MEELFLCIATCGTFYCIYLMIADYKNNYGFPKEKHKGLYHCPECGKLSCMDRAIVGQDLELNRFSTSYRLSHYQPYCLSCRYTGVAAYTKRPIGT